MSRIERTFQRLAETGEAAFIPFIMAGDPDAGTTATLLDGLPARGADIIELGVAFTDPMADGPTIQAAGLRALNNGQTLKATLDLVKSFRTKNDTTPIVLMGYFNPFYRYEGDVLADAIDAGVDGLIIVDLPPEEDAEFAEPARAAGLDIIRLATPTTDERRLPHVLRQASGFVYYVSVAGITGAAAGGASDIETAVSALKSQTDMPVAVGFGIKTPDRAAEIARVADGVVVGSALVDALEAGGPDAALSLAETLATAVKTARG